MGELSSASLSRTSVARRRGPVVVRPLRCRGPAPGSGPAWGRSVRAAAAGDRASGLLYIGAACITLSP